MKGDFRLLRQGGGKGAFAHVYVETDAGTSDSDDVILALPTSEETTGRRLEPDREFVEAAKEGCRSALTALEKLGLVTTSQTVRVTEIETNVVDTRIDAVKCAAFLATAQAFNAADWFVLRFNDVWEVIPRETCG